MPALVGPCDGCGRCITTSWRSGDPEQPHRCSGCLARQRRELATQRAKRVKALRRKLQAGALSLAPMVGTLSVVATLPARPLPASPARSCGLGARTVRVPKPGDVCTCVECFARWIFEEGDDFTQVCPSHREGWVARPATGILKPPGSGSGVRSPPGHIDAYLAMVEHVEGIVRSATDTSMRLPDGRMLTDEERLRATPTPTPIPSGGRLRDH